MIKHRITQHSLVTEAHQTVLKHQPKPIISLDATMGNGHDTLFLARHSDKVYAFDIQALAIEATQKRLENSKFKDKVTLIHASHDKLSDYIANTEKIDIAMFNLGYLPKADTTIITQSHSTLIALNAAILQLSSQGIISIIAYRGHAGGQTETDAIEVWCQQLDSALFNVCCIHSQHETESSPLLFTIHAK